MEFMPTTISYVGFDSKGKNLLDGYLDDVYQNQHRKDNLDLILNDCKKQDETKTKKVKYFFVDINDEQTSEIYLEILKNL